MSIAQAPPTRESNAYSQCRFAGESYARKEPVQVGSAMMTASCTHERPRRMRWAIGFMLVAAGAALWAIAVGFVVPAARAGENAAMAMADRLQGVPDDRWLSLWVHDLRWAAIVVVVCGLALTVRGTGLRRRSVPVVCGVALLAVDGMFTWLDVTGLWAAAA